MSDLTAKKEVAPLREVRKSYMRAERTVQDFRVLTLSCGHTLIRQPAQKIPKRARCNDCLSWSDT